LPCLGGSHDDHDDGGKGCGKGKDGGKGKRNGTGRDQGKGKNNAHNEYGGGRKE
jgi:hypothetical protein